MAIYIHQERQDGSTKSAHFLVASIVNVGDCKTVSVFFVVVVLFFRIGLRLVQSLNRSLNQSRVFATVGVCVCRMNTSSKEIYRVCGLD